MVAVLSNEVKEQNMCEGRSIKSKSSVVSSKAMHATNKTNVHCREIRVDKRQDRVRSINLDCRKVFLESCDKVCKLQSMKGSMSPTVCEGQSSLLICMLLDPLSRTVQ